MNGILSRKFEGATIISIIIKLGKVLSLVRLGLNAGPIISFGVSPGRLIHNKTNPNKVGELSKSMHNDPVA